MQVQIESLRRSYGSFTALDDVTFTIPSGAVLALAGPNGAGKTTMMKIIAGLTVATSGRVLLGELDVGEHPREAHRYLGFLGDFFGLYEDLTVREFLSYFARAYSLPRETRDASIEKIIAKCRLEHKADSAIKALSRGLRQRVGIARTLINDPPVILLDEPSAGLDPEARNDLQNLFLELGGEGKTLIVSSHILTELEDYCSHVALLNKGKLVSFGELDGLRNNQNQKRRFTMEVLGSVEDAQKALSTLPAVSDLKATKNRYSFLIAGDAEVQADVLAAIVKLGVRVSSFGEETGRIQEAYLAHMKGTRE